MPQSESWQRGLQHLCDQGVLAGYALMTRQGHFESAQGILRDAFCSHTTEQLSSDAQQLDHVFDSGQQAETFTLLNQKIIVFKQTACDVYGISRRKHMGLCLNNLPFGLLISVYQKPCLPQTVIPKLENICASLRR